MKCRRELLVILLRGEYGPLKVVCCDKAGGAGEAMLELSRRCAIVGTRRKSGGLNEVVWKKRCDGADR